MKHFKLWGYGEGESLLKDLAAFTAVTLFGCAIAALALAAA